MEFKRYQNQSKRFARYKEFDKVLPLAYLVLGFESEVGVIATQVMNVLRDHDGVVPDDIRQLLIEECGKILWYLTQMCTELNIDLDLVALKNIAKLQKAKYPNPLYREGDDQ